MQSISRTTHLAVWQNLLLKVLYAVIKGGVYWDIGSTELIVEVVEVKMLCLRSVNWKLFTKCGSSKMERAGDVFPWRVVDALSGSLGWPRLVLWNRRLSD